jgi:hypothetical protein
MGWACPCTHDVSPRGHRRSQEHAGSLSCQPRPRAHTSSAALRSFAKAGKSSREEWLAFTKDYFLNRDNLVSVLLLIDSSVPPQTVDRDCANWLAECEVRGAASGSVLAPRPSAVGLTCLGHTCVGLRAGGLCAILRGGRPHDCCTA